MSVDTTALRALLAAATKGPWQYRPDPCDDWGFIRAPNETPNRMGWIPAVARAGRDITEAEYSEHRRNGTDPYGPNAALIVALVNNAAALLDAADEAAWRPIATAPLKGFFHTPRANGDIAKVERFIDPAASDLVIVAATGRFWRAKVWRPIPALTPPTTADREDQ